jgi:hypothetical protein
MRAVSGTHLSENGTALFHHLGYAKRAPYLDQFAPRNNRFFVLREGIENEEDGGGIVIDDNGYLWLDEDGRFNDSRLKKSMSNDSIVLSSDKVDDTDTNNTIGPFLLKELEIIKDDSIQKYNKEYELPFNQEWFLLDYFTINNDALGIIDTNKMSELNSFINEALNKNMDFNMVLSIQICTYNVYPRYVLLK